MPEEKTDSQSRKGFHLLARYLLGGDIARQLEECGIPPHAVELMGWECSAEGDRVPLSN